jgi:hypothetical protein
MTVSWLGTNGASPAEYLPQWCYDHVMITVELFACRVRMNATHIALPPDLLCVAVFRAPQSSLCQHSRYVSSILERPLCSPNEGTPPPARGVIISEVHCAPPLCLGLDLQLLSVGLGFSQKFAQSL